MGKTKVTQEEYDQMSTPIWPDVGLRRLMTFWRWILLACCIGTWALMPSVGAAIYFLVIATLVFVFVRHLPADELLERLYGLQSLWRRRPYWLR